MNRIFGIAGLLATGSTVLCVLLIIVLPWFPVYSSRSPAPLAWFLWAVVSLIGLGGVYISTRSALLPHWAALRHNALPSAAWRGICGVYVFVMLAFALPVLSGDPSGTHRAEMYLYIGLTGISMVLSVVAFSRGFRRAI